MASVAEHLLNAEEVRKRVVERAFHISFVGPAVGNVAREGPSLVAQSGVECVHAAQSIAAVCAAECYSVSGRHVGRSEVVVVRSAHARHCERVALEWER